MMLCSSFFHRSTNLRLNICCRIGKVIVLVLLLLPLAACGSKEPASEGHGSGAPRSASKGGDSKGGSKEGAQSARRGGPPPGVGGGGGSRGGGGGPPPGVGAGAGAGAEQDRGVPVEVASVVRRPIAAYFQTQGTLEAENEVDLVARTAGPIVALKTEEGRTVRTGQLLARIDDREIRAQLTVAEVQLEETEKAYERAKTLHQNQLVSQEALDQALANYQSAQGDFERIRIQLQYTEIKAPFAGLIVERYVKLAENLAVNDRLFRLSDFDPLLSTIQVPERELPRLSVGQVARVTVEAWPGEFFPAKVLRVSPVVEAATGTVRVTLELDRAAARQKLRPGMFASVDLEMENRPQALVIPKAALALDSLGDTVFVVRDGVAERRQVQIGLRNENLLEVVGGVEEQALVIVVGQDGLSSGTPVDVLTTEVSAPRSPEGLMDKAGSPDDSARSSSGRGSGFGRPGIDLDLDDPAAVEQLKARMRQRGLSDEQIEQRLQRMRERRGGG